MRISTILATLCLVLCGAAWAGPVDDAAEHIKAKRYDQALKLLEPLAAKGDPLAMGHLSRLYANGWGVQEDERRSIELAQQAEKGGSPEGTNVLALAHMRSGGSEGVMEGLRLLKKAANQGYGRAQVNLGQWFQRAKVLHSAEHWFREAAQGGDVDGQYLLASLLAAKSSADDLPEAVKWMRLAAKGGDEGAIKELPELEKRFASETAAAQAKKLKEQQAVASEKAKARAGKFSSAKANLSAQVEARQIGGLTFHVLRLTSKDDEPFVVERVVLNNREKDSNCDLGDLAALMRTGDTNEVRMGKECGQTLVRATVETNRGTFRFSF